MMGRAVTLAVLAALAAVLLITRPGPHELKLDRERAKRNGGRKQAQSPEKHLEASWSDLKDVVLRRQMEVLRDPHRALASLWDLSTPTLTDYGIITVAAPIGKGGLARSEVRLVGALGSFVAYRPRDDLPLLACVLVASYLVSWLSPWLVRSLATPSLWRPWTMILTTLYSSSLLGTMMCASTIVNSGEQLQADIGREKFLIFFFASGAIAAVGEVIGRHHPRPVGPIGAAWGMLLYISLRHPAVTFTVYGKVVSAHMLMGLQLAMPLTSDPRAFFYQVPTFASGAACGLAAFVLFAEPDLASLSEKLRLDAFLGETFLPEGLSSTGLVQGILAANFFFGQLFMALHHSCQKAFS